MVEIETRKLSEIVLGMLAENVPEDQILANLQQSGIDETLAKQVLEKAKLGFEAFAESKLEKVVSKMVEEKTEKKMAELKKEFLLQRDLKMMEQKEYTDKKIAAEKIEIDSLKSDISSSKVTLDAGLKKIQSKIDLLGMSGSTQKMLSIGLLLAGIFALCVIILFGYNLMTYITQRKPLDVYILLYVLVMVLAAIGAVICLRVGYRIYSIGEKQFERTGLRAIQGEKKEEEGSIQELIKEKEVI